MLQRICTRYYLCATIVSIGWYPVLLVPSLSRDWLLSRASVPLDLGLLAVAGVCIAHFFKNFIISADGAFDRIVRATVLPLLGSALYLVLTVITLWLHQAFYGGLANVHDSMSLVVTGLVATIISCYVTIPYGFICQLCLEWSAKE